MEVRCPQCHTPVELASDGELSDITCPSCGSSFSLLGSEETAPYEPGETRTIGHFELVEQIGVGTFGSVWRAKDVELDRTVAVKIPRKGQLDPGESEQFLREARAAAQLRHGGIVSVHEVGREDDTVFIVSDFVEGVTLADRLTAQPFTIREAAELCAKIADALHHAHESGVVHRDLKPGNIILDADGEPHIMDFGLARREAGEVTMTVEGRVLGTPAYMSPEQAKGDAHTADRRSDVYSLGVILFELLTGERPFRGNARMLVHQVINDEAPSPRRLNGSVPRDLETICLKCLEKEPGKRYLTADRLQSDLKRFLAGEPIHARAITQCERSWRWCKRNKVVALLTVTTVTTLLLGAAVSLYSARTAIAVARQRTLDLYVSDMNVAQQAWTENNSYRALEVLKKYLPGGEPKLREFEWYYFWNQCHLVPSEQIPLEFQGNSVAFSPNGKLLAVGQFGGPQPIELFEQLNDASWRRIDRFGPASRRSLILSLAFTPDGNSLIHPCGNGEIGVRSLDDKKERVLGDHDGTVKAVAISPDGQLLASGGEDDFVVVRSLTTEKSESLPVGIGGVYALAFSPDGALLATGGVDGHVRIWDATSYTELRDFEPKGDFFAGANGGSLAFSHDSKSVVWAGENNTILIARIDEHEPVSIDSGHIQEIRAFACSPVEHELATGSRDCSITLWNLRTSSADRVLKGHGAYVQSLAYSPDGFLLASASRDFTVRVWDLMKSRTQPESIHVEGFITDMFFLESADRLIVLLDRDKMIFVNTRTGEVGQPIKMPPGNALRATASNGGLIGTVSDDELQVWRPGETEAELVFPTNGDVPPTHGDTSPFEFSPNGRYLAMGCTNGLVKIWDINHGSLLATIAHRGRVGSVAFTAQPPVRLATGGDDGQVKLWDVLSGEQFPMLGSHRSIVDCLTFSPDGKLLVSGSFDNTIMVWNLDEPDANPATLTGHAGPVKHLVFSQGGRTFISCGGEGRIRVWDARSLKTKAVLKTRKAVYRLAWSEDECVLASAQYDGGPIRLWHAPKLPAAELP